MINDYESMGRIDGKVSMFSAVKIMHLKQILVVAVKRKSYSVAWIPELCRNVETRGFHPLFCDFDFLFL